MPWRVIVVYENAPTQIIASGLTLTDAHIRRAQEQYGRAFGKVLIEMEPEYVHET